MKNETVTKALLSKFKTALQEDEKSIATTEKYIRDTECFFRFAAERSIDKNLVLEYKAYLSRKYAVRSANSMIAALNSFFRFAGFDELCVKQFRVQASAFESEERELSRTEYEKLVRTAEKSKNKRLSLVIQTICGTGIRVSELKFITAEAVKSGVAEVSLKGKNRKVFIVSKLRNKLLNYLKEIGIKSGPVFLTRGGRPLERTSVWKEMKSLCKIAGVSDKKVFPHNLRHLFARTYYSLQKDIVRLSDILGHSSINTTRIYTMETGDILTRHIEKLGLLRC